MPVTDAGDVRGHHGVVNSPRETPARETANARAHIRLVGDQLDIPEGFHHFEGGVQLRDQQTCESALLRFAFRLVHWF